MKKGSKKIIFEKGIELVGSCLIENTVKKILMVRSSSAWNNRWMLPGGHIEAGEKIIDALVREGEEETGLRLKPVSIFYHGEWIGKEGAAKPAHLVYFDLYSTTEGNDVRLQKEELEDYGWFHPEAALRLNLAPDYDNTIRAFIEFKKGYGEKKKKPRRPS